jgi:hypothetical protein
MQRWWYTDDSKNGRDKTPKSKKSPTKQIDGIRMWKFSVVVTSELNKNEKIAVVGSCEQLGEWDPDHSVLLEKGDGKNADKWGIVFPRILFISGETCFLPLFFVFSPSAATISRTSWMFFARKR